MKEMLLILQHFQKSYITIKSRKVKSMLIAIKEVKRQMGENMCYAYDKGLI